MTEYRHTTYGFSSTGSYPVPCILQTSIRDEKNTTMIIINALICARLVARKKDANMKTTAWRAPPFPPTPPPLLFLALPSETSPSLSQGKAPCRPLIERRSPFFFCLCQGCPLPCRVGLTFLRVCVDSYLMAFAQRGWELGMKGKNPQHNPGDLACLTWLSRKVSIPPPPAACHGKGFGVLGFGRGLALFPRVGGQTGAQAPGTHSRTPRTNTKSCEVPHRCRQ